MSLMKRSQVMVANQSVSHNVGKGLAVGGFSALGVVLLGALLPVLGTVSLAVVMGLIGLFMMLR